MEDWIAGLLAMLGTLLVLGGGAATVLGTVSPATTSGQATSNSSMWSRLRRLSGADRLLLWGVVLLVISAIAAGAISFSLDASAGTR